MFLQRKTVMAWGGLALTSLLATTATATDLENIRNLAGCYVVDYSYSEEEVLAENYTLDPRIYDVTQFTVKEYVKVVDEDSDSVRLQHFMQADSFAGQAIFKMRHHAEIWHRAPMTRFQHDGRYGESDRWSKVPVPAEQWVREITNLDDGLRYQCAGTWQEGHSFPRFDCAAFAPIPGRETRDMGRRDYNTMDRTASVLLYGDAWLERQENVKVQFSGEGRTELVREKGKIWSVRVPDSECAEVAAWASERQAFWDVLAEAWQDAYAQDRPFHEVKKVGGTTRGEKIGQLLEDHYQTIGDNEEERAQVKTLLDAVIEAHRE